MISSECNGCEYQCKLSHIDICTLGSPCPNQRSTPMTNEEWLRSATFEEMAGTLYEWYSQGHIEGKVGKQLSSVTRVVEWLKQPHDNILKP